MIVLATAVIISITNSNLVEKAKQARKLNNEKTLLEAANLVYSSLYAEKSINGIVTDYNSFTAEVREILKTQGFSSDEVEKIVVSEKGVSIVNEDIIEKELQGKYIFAEEVSSAIHDVEINLTSDTVTDFSDITVYRYNSNLWDISQMLTDNVTVDENNNYTFTYKDTNKHFSDYCNVNIPAGIPFYLSVDILENNLSHNLFIELSYDEGEPEFFEISKGGISVTPEKTVTKMRLYIVYGVNQVGDNVKFKDPKLNIGGERAYEKYVDVKSVKANANGKVEGITSISPNMTIISSNSNVNINCKYKKIASKYNLFGKTIVNLGDSIFGMYSAPSDISSFLSRYTETNVYNAGFEGSRMAWHLDYWNAFSIYSLADAIVSKDFKVQEEAIKNSTELPELYKNRLETLKSIDFSKVDIITISCGTNDFTGANPTDDKENKYHTGTFGGALRYSIETISNAYPNLKIVLCTPTYRAWYDENGNFLYDSNTYNGVWRKINRLCSN